MASLWLFVALSGLAVMPVFSQTTDQTAFANPPPLPATGIQLASMHDQFHTGSVQWNLPFKQYI